MVTSAAKSPVPEAQLVKKGLLGHFEEYVLLYLLGNLEEHEKESFEELLFSQDSVFEQVQVMQDELIDRYISGSLLEGEKSAVEKRILSNPENRQKLKTAAMLRKFALESLDPEVRLHITAAA